jgi:hypothetical protein
LSSVVAVSFISHLLSRTAAQSSGRRGRGSLPSVKLETVGSVAAGLIPIRKYPRASQPPSNPPIVLAI